jgi:hypothetical protein
VYNGLLYIGVRTRTLILLLAINEIALLNSSWCLAMFARGKDTVRNWEKTSDSMTKKIV